jgi:hypothetical protein
MRVLPLTISAAVGAALCLLSDPGELRASHAPVPEPPEIVFVGVETDASGSFGPEVVTGYWHVFDVTSKGGSDWVTGHNGNAYKLWRRKDSSGGSQFVTDGIPRGSRQSTFRIRFLVSPAQFEWTNSFYVTEIGGQSLGSETAPSEIKTVTTPMPPFILDERFGAAAAAGFLNTAGSPRSVSSLQSMLAEEPEAPTFRMLVFGFNIGWPEYAWSETAPVPETYARPKIRWNGEMGLVSGERMASFGNALEFDVPRELLYDTDGTGTATVEVVQGTAGVVSDPYALTLAPAPPAPRNVSAVADARKPAKKAQVRVTWEPPPGGGVPAEYVIQRRLRPDPASELKLTYVYEDIGIVPGNAKRLEFTDKKAPPDEALEYRVGISGQPLLVSKEDDAHTPAAKPIRYVLPDYPLWQESFQALKSAGGSGNSLVPDDDVRMVRVDVEGEPKVTKFILWSHGVWLEGTLPKALLRRSKIVIPVKPVKFDEGVQLPSWANAVKFRGRADLALTLQGGPTRDADTFLLIGGGLRIGKDFVPLTFTRELPLDRVPKGLDFAATVGVGAKAAEPGEAVVVVFECVNLGDDGGTNFVGPLLWGQAFVDVHITNGSILQVFDEATTGHFEAVSDVAGFTNARFKLGALGRDEKGKPQVARLTLLVEVDRPTSGPNKMRCRFSMASDPDTRKDEFAGLVLPRIVSKTGARVVDVEILK